MNVKKVVVTRVAAEESLVVIRNAKSANLSVMFCAQL